MGCDFPTNTSVETFFPCLTLNGTSKFSRRALAQSVRGCRRLSIRENAAALPGGEQLRTHPAKHRLNSKANLLFAMNTQHHFSCWTWPPVSSIALGSRDVLRCDPNKVKGPTTAPRIQPQKAPNTAQNGGPEGTRMNKLPRSNKPPSAPMIAPATPPRKHQTTIRFKIFFKVLCMITRYKHRLG